MYFIGCIRLLKLHRFFIRGVYTYMSGGRRQCFFLLKHKNSIQLTVKSGLRMLID